MLEKKHFIIVLLLVLFISRYSQAEIIDGPANVRDTPRGSILFELNDYIQVFKDACEGDWCSITLRVEVPESAMDGNKIKANQILRYFPNGAPIGKTIKAVTLISPGRRTSEIVTGIISGSTNIRNLRITISTDLKKLFDLVPGYYVITDIVEEKQKQYCPGRFDSIPHIFFGEIEIRRQDSGLIFSFGNFHEGLSLGFVVHENGSVDGNICFDKSCVNKIAPLDNKTFRIDISDHKPITLMSTTDLKEMCESENETK